ncbi:MAG: PadR family transcriptional regulator [Thermomicrobiales bacterium]
MQKPAPQRRERSGRFSPAEYALLGLLAVAQSEAGVHGYDLGRRFQDGPLAEIIRLEPGMLYHYLKKLAKTGNLTTSIEHQSSRPDRQDHTLTEDGMAVLENWLKEPVRATRDIRLEFLLKLYFARRIDPDQAQRLVQEQRAVISALVGSLAKQRDALDEQQDGEGMRRIVLDLRIAQTQAVLGWLNALPEALSQETLPARP